MKFRVIAFALVLVLPLWVHVFGSNTSSSSIQATATVMQPMGFIEAQELADEWPAPILAEYAARWFLFLPRQSSVLVQFNGEQIETLHSDGGIITSLELSTLADSRASSEPAIVTLIYSEN